MKETTYEANNFIADTLPPAISSGITIKKGQGILAKGTVLGEVSATKLFAMTDKASADGSEKASVVLAEEVDTNQTEDVKAAAYKSGCFFVSALTFGGASTISDHANELRDLNIYVK